MIFSIKRITLFKIFNGDNWPRLLVKKGIEKLCVFTIIIFSIFLAASSNALAANSQVLQISKYYMCKAQFFAISDVPSTKYDIEFSYRDSDKSSEILENLYIKIPRLKTKSWDALHSSESSYEYWTTPVLRDIPDGLNPLTITLDIGNSPDPVLKASFGGNKYPVECKITN